MLKTMWLALAPFAVAVGGISAFAADDGAALYSSNCASCHGANGAAETPVAKAMNVPGLVGTSMSADAIAKHVTESDKHKAQADKLTPKDLAAIGSFIERGFK